MTIFLCILAALSLGGVGEFRLTGTVTLGTIIALRTFQTVLTLGLATLALLSYLS